MKKIFLLFIFAFGFSQAQMPNISKVWLNDNLPYNGGFGNENILKISFISSEQNKKNDQDYFISGIVEKLGQENKIEGTLFIKKYRDQRNGGKIFGNYEIAEENTGKNTGIYKGKFVFHFDWDKDTKQISNKKIEFNGKWKNYSNNQEIKTNWRN